MARRHSRGLSGSIQGLENDKEFILVLAISSNGTPNAITLIERENKIDKRKNHESLR